MRQLKQVASKALMGAIPFSPFLMASQTASVPIPTEVSNPTPVTTTLRDKLGLPQKQPVYFFLIYFFFDSM
jgi:hypothetical protein